MFDLHLFLRCWSIFGGTFKDLIVCHVSNSWRQALFLSTKLATWVSHYTFVPYPPPSSSVFSVNRPPLFYDFSLPLPRYLLIFPTWSLSQLPPFFFSSSLSHIWMTYLPIFSSFKIVDGLKVQFLSLILWALICILFLIEGEFMETISFNEFFLGWVRLKLKQWSGSFKFQVSIK